MHLSTDPEPIRRRTRSDKLPDSWKVRTRRSYPFIGWDGEGYSVNGQHHYALFGNSNGARVQAADLDYTDCLPLLFDSPKQAVHVIFAGTYDVVMMFRNTKQIGAIMSGQWVRVARYGVRFLKGKSLTVKDSVTGESRTLYDVFSFFQCSFVKACREYLDTAELISVPDWETNHGDKYRSYSASIGTILEAVETMKLQRAEFTGITPEIRSYMTTELVLLAKLCTVLRERLAAVDIHPSRWHGPGAVAATVLKAENVNRYRRVQPQALTDAAEAAYYGGRFEMMKRGTYIGLVYQYDIRSAYPYAMSRLPSIDCEWSHITTGKIVVAHDYALYYVRSRNMSTGTHPIEVPYRNPFGMIYFPDWVCGWYWGVELPYGMKAAQAWIPEIDWNVTPFSFVHEMYQRRAALKAAGKPEQLALKLALNSLYGKLAQSKGANWNGKQWTKPTYHEPLWAGYITAYTRSMIQHAISLAGDDCIAAETDAVFSTKPLDLPLGTDLGQWEQTVYDGIKYVQSGVHMTLQDGVWSYKTRGLTMRRNASDDCMWDDLLDRGAITIRQVRFGTDPRQVNFGQWYSQNRRLVLDHIEAMEKRINVGPCEQCHPDADGFYRIPDYDTHLHRMVVPPVPMNESTPYRFIWNHPNPLDPTVDDPTLYLEYQPETIREEIIG